MCETLMDPGTRRVVTDHGMADYNCPSCNVSLCWQCNPKDQRGSWHGECLCPLCGETIVEGDFS